MKSLDEVLAEHPFFQNLDQQYLELMRGCATNASYHAGDYLFHEGEKASHFYVVRHGRIAIEMYAAPMGSIAIETVDAGEVLGWSWLFPPYTWHFSARAVSDTRVTTLDGTCLRDKCESDHDFGYELMKRASGIIVQRLQSTRAQLLDAYDKRSL